MKKEILWILLGSSLAVACGESGAPSTPASTDKDSEKQQAVSAKPEASAARSGKALLVTQSRFKADDKGQYTVPDAAELLVLQPEAGRWSVQKIEDTESNVFHKALPYGKEGILTLGGNAALLKVWRKDGTAWKAETLWNPVFGGKQNRLRDFELADFDGDGQQDLAIATHDQGVVAVVWRRGAKWEPTEIDRKSDTFVHEIEIGDLDKDGKKEIYATPSEPNTATAEQQGGKIVRYAWDGAKFVRSEVVALETRHIKEVLVADVDGDGSEELYAAVEAETSGMEIKKPVEIRRYDPKGESFSERTIATLENERFCRFLVAGDLDGDGQKELVASAFSTGVWVFEHADGVYRGTCIDAKSGGFEHAAYIADIDQDKQNELYVADDRAGLITQYKYVVGTYQPKPIQRRLIASQAMVWNITEAEF